MQLTRLKRINYYGLGRKWSLYSLIMGIQCLKKKEKQILSNFGNNFFIKKYRKILFRHP